MKLFINRYDFYCCKEIDLNKFSALFKTDDLYFYSGYEYYFDSKQNKTRILTKEKQIYVMYQDVLYWLCKFEYLDKVKKAPKQDILIFIGECSESNINKRNEEKRKKSEERENKRLEKIRMREQEKQNKVIELKIQLKEVKEKILNNEEITIDSDFLTELREYKIIIFPLTVQKAINNLSSLVVKDKKVQILRQYGKSSFKTYDKIIELITLT